MELFKILGTIACDVSEAEKNINSVTNEAKKIGNGFKESNSTASKSLSQIAAENGKTVNEIKSEVGKIAAAYRKEGLNASEAMKKAYADIGYRADESSKKIKKTADKISDNFDKASKEIINSGNKTESSIKDNFDDVEDKARSSGNHLESIFKKIGTAVVTYFAVDKIKDFGTACVEMSATVAAEQSAFEQIMGDYSDTAQEKMGEVADATGMVDTRLTPYMTSMTAKFKGLGYGIEDATDYAQDGLSLAADAAAFWDKSLDESISHLNSFVNGSYEGGEAIGLFANDTQMAAYAVEKGLVSEAKEWSKLEEKIKQATRLEYAQNMMEQSGAVGQAAKESGEYANVMANFSEKWRQVQAAIGEPILQNIVLPAVEKLSDFMTERFAPAVEMASDFFVNRFLPAAKSVADYLKDKFMSIFGNVKKLIKNNLDVFESLRKAVKKLFEIIVDAGKTLLDFAEWLTGSSEGAEELRDIILAVTTAFVAYKAVMIAHNTVMKAGKKAVDLYRKAQLALKASSPFAWVAGAVAGITALVVALDDTGYETGELTEEQKKLAEEHRKLAGEIDNLHEEYTLWAEARDETISGIDAEFDYYTSLKEELQGIADENGKVKEGYEDRAQFIINELSEATGTEIEMTDGVISKYDELVQKMDDVLQKKKLNALISADEENYADAIKALKEDGEDGVTAKYNENKSELETATTDLNAGYAEKARLSNLSDTEKIEEFGTYKDWSDAYLKQDDINAALSENYNNIKKSFDEAAEMYYDYTSTVMQYESNFEAQVSDDSEKINLAIEKTTRNFQTAETANAETLERQTKNLESEIAEARKSNAPKEFIDMLHTLYTDSRIEWSKVIKSGEVGVVDYCNGLYNITNSEKPIVGETVNSLNKTISDGLRFDGASIANESIGEFNATATVEYNKSIKLAGKKGKETGLEYENGIDQSKSGVEKTAKSMGEAAANSAKSADFKGAGTKSGESFVSGMASTIKSGVMGLLSNINIPEITVPVKSYSGPINSPSDAKLVGHATGGIVTREHIARVGEDGAEAIIPLEKNTEWIDRVAARMSGSASNSAVMAKLDELISLLKNQKIYLDGKTLVGGISGEMDKKLGSMARLKRRTV